MKHVVIAGATGLVGQELVRQLHARPDVSITALVRGTGRLQHLSARVVEIPFDFEDPAGYAKLGSEIPCDVLLCALGTTMAKAGSEEAFRKVDLDYPVALMRRAAELDPKPLFAAVSSVGAGAPKGLYLKVKAEMEAALRASGLPWVILRPGLLLGDRDERRPGESFAKAFAGPYLAIARGFFPRTRLVWKYAPIPAETVASAMLRACLDAPPPAEGRLLEGLSLHHPILGEA